MDFEDKATKQLPPANKLVSDLDVDEPLNPRKRRRSIDEIADGDEAFEAYSISACHSRTGQSFRFIPISTLLRAHVPLSWLAVISHRGGIPSATLLEAEIISNLRLEYRVLVAQHIPKGGLYALERVEDQTMICWPLHEHVTLSCIQQASIGATPSVPIGDLLATAHVQSHFRKSSTSSNAEHQPAPIGLPPLKLPQNRRGVLARQSILGRERTAELSENFPGSQGVEGARKIPSGRCSTIIAEPAEKVQRALEGHEQEDILLEPAPIAPDVAPKHSCFTIAASALNLDGREQIDQLSTDYLRKRYLEMLYLSKTSLAFYAKGPLSRTRSRARAPGASLSIHQLVEFYQDSILSSKKLDLKYKSSIQAKVLSLPPIGGSAAAEQMLGQGKGSARKPRKSRKTKLGKDALWPMEEEFIEKWWRGNCAAVSSNPAQAADLHNAVSALRIREVELQIILILEVLALESRDIAKLSAPTGTSGDPRIKLEATEVESQHHVAALSSDKRTRNLNLELDALLDKLCIWHSVCVDDSFITPDSEQSGSLAPESTMKDRLRDFCKEVVIPFYAGKLPDQGRNICKKLGGLNFFPTSRSKPTTERSTSRIPPGAMIPPGERTTVKRTLERVLSEDQTIRNASPPALTRSSTLPVALGNKREQSECPGSRGGMRKSMSFTNREIDLVADARLTASKKRKLDAVAAQKRELSSAIETLKKPNRHLIARVMMDEIESRNTERRPTTKKIEPIQITATPRKARWRPSSEDEYDLPPLASSMRTADEAVVLSSAVKPRELGHGHSIVRWSATKKAVLSALHDASPSSELRLTLGSGPHDTETGFTPVYSDRDCSSSTLVNSTPMRMRMRPDLMETIAHTPIRSSQSRQPVALSPTKHTETAIERIFKDIPEIAERANKMMARVMGATNEESEGSIYDSLGWNDDYDL